MNKDIIKRWNERVIPNGWDKDPNGADHYVSKYGKQISQEKLKALRDYAEDINCHLFVDGISKFIVSDSSDDYMRDLVGKERTSGVNGDAQSEYEYCKENGETVRLVETTVKHLSKIKAETQIGCKFEELDVKFNNLKIRTCYNVETNTITSFDAYLKNESDGYEIENWGTRFEDAGDEDGWWYFEDE